MGLVDTSTSVAWPEACSVPGSLIPLGGCKRPNWPLVKCGQRLLFLRKNHLHLLSSTFLEILLHAGNTALQGPRSLFSWQQLGSADINPVNTEHTECGQGP